jgi:hypothetical protein
MNITKTENAIIEHLRKLRIATKKDLCSTFKVSHMTVIRALKKQDYYTSYNMNSAYYVLKNTPKFDKNGLWFCKAVYFSRYGTLGETLMALVEMSPAGFTVSELELKVRVKVGTLLSRLCRQKCLARFYAGRQVVYLSINPERRASQKGRRQQQIGEARSLIHPKKREGRKLPEGFDALSVIAILIQMIRAPNTSVASISQTLQKREIKITAEQVRNVIEFYSLKKKGEL